MAQHNDSYEFSAVEAREILAEREQGWAGFTRFLTVSIVATVVVLLAMLIFVV